MASLRILGDDGSERIVQLRDRKVQIGRGRDNDIVLPDSQKGVSRTHAELRCENGRYIIVDLQSQNGTWLNGQRVERAEVPPGAEITVGEYRIVFQQTDAPSVSAATTSLRDPIDDFGMRTKALPDPLRARASAAPPATRPFPIALVGIAGLVVVAALIWALMARQANTPSAAEPRASEPAAAAPREQAPLPATGVPTAASPIEPATSAAARRSDASPPPAGSKTPARRPQPAADKTAPEWSSTGLDVGGVDLTRVQRKPGESTDAWRTRGAALHTRYAYSKQALDRGDYAGAAGGFEAILMEEPGFLDAPQLLVQANAGLRVSARDLFDAGNRLDGVGDWVGALQKYEQARLIHSGVPGLLPAMKRVREKLQLAGTNAFNQARQYEASGRAADAVKEYEKAFQWLPPDDPNREIARTRVDQLKRHD